MADNNENGETAENKVTDNNPEATLREVRVFKSFIQFL
jgi:hypothetical protein